MNIDIGIDEASRDEIAKGLSRLLADTYTLFLMSHNFHWNVTGPMFQSLHALFEHAYGPFIVLDVRLVPADPLGQMRSCRRLRLADNLVTSGQAGIAFQRRCAGATGNLPGDRPGRLHPPEALMLEQTVDYILFFAYYYPLFMAYVWMCGGVYYRFHWENEGGEYFDDPKPLSESPKCGVLIRCRSSSGA